MEAYCVKCRSKKKMVDVKESPLKNGKKALQGSCETCESGVFIILPKLK